MRIVLFTLTAASLFFAGCVESSILLDVKPGERRCIADSVRVGSDTTFSFRVPERNMAEGMKVKITHPFGPDYSDALKNDWTDHVIAQAKEEGGGTYNVCFQNTNLKEMSRVEVKEETVPVNQGARPLIVNHLQKVDKLLQYAKKVAESLKGQMRETVTSEEEGSKEDERLRSRINTGSCFTMIVLIAASAWQLILLNKFFRSKKLI